jgi:hypothetical protein
MHVNIYTARDHYYMPVCLIHLLHEIASFLDN